MHVTVLWQLQCTVWVWPLGSRTPSQTKSDTKDELAACSNTSWLCLCVKSNPYACLLPDYCHHSQNHSALPNPHAGPLQSDRLYSFAVRPILCDKAHVGEHQEGANEHAMPIKQHKGCSSIDTCTKVTLCHTAACFARDALIQTSSKHTTAVVCYP